jgi:hypothetical protein
MGRPNRAGPGEAGLGGGTAWRFKLHAVWALAMHNDAHANGKYKCKCKCKGQYLSFLLSSAILGRSFRLRSSALR